jgi:hypothetical protein
MVITRPCRCCGTFERVRPRAPAWARWTGEVDAGWPGPDGPRQVAPAPGSEIELTLRGPLAVEGEFGALFVPWPAAADGLDEHPAALAGVRALDLEPLEDRGDRPGHDGLTRACLLARVRACHTLDDLAAGDGPTDRPAWHEPACLRHTRLLPLPGGVLVSFSMQGDVSGAWWLRREARGWRLLLEEDDAGLHVGWAYAGGHLLDADELTWLATLDHGA